MLICHIGITLPINLFLLMIPCVYLCVRIVDSPNPDLSVKTTDGGKHWIDMRQPFKEISFITSNLGYACGDSGLASKTTDGWFNME